MSRIERSMLIKKQKWIFGSGCRYDEAIEKGATEDEALLATLLSSTANAIVEIGGGVEQLPGELREAGLTSKDKIRKWVSSSLDEGKEEVVQGMIERLVNKAVYDQDAPWNDDTGKNEDAVFNFDQSLKEFGTGAAIGGILGGGQMLAQGIAARGQRIVDPTASPFDQAVLDTLQGVQTPENVTQVREPTELDNIIMETQMQLQSGISPEVATNKPKDVKNLLNATKEQITRYIQNAFNKQNQYKFLKISDVSPELAETLRAAGIEVEGYAHALRDNDIRHVDNSPGSKSNDKYKVTAEVMEQAQNIIDNYDNLYRGYDTKGGNPTVVYEKQMGNRTFYVEEVLDDGVLGTKQMVITGEDSKPSFLKKYTKIASVSGDTDVPALSGSKGVQSGCAVERRHGQKRRCSLQFRPIVEGIRNGRSNRRHSWRRADAGAGHRRKGTENRRPDGKPIRSGGSGHLAGRADAGECDAGQGANRAGQYYYGDADAAAKRHQPGSGDE